MFIIRSALPTELCERIIDFVADRGEGADDMWLPEVYPTLQACALTCRAWLARSRFHLFRVVGVGKQGKTFEKFVSLVEANPILQEFVYTFLVHGEAERKGSNFRLLPLKIPRLLRKLTTLNLQNDTLCPQPSFFASLRQFTNIQQLGFRSVAFQSVQDFRRMLCSLPNLQELAISYPRWLPGPNGVPPPPSVRQHPRLLVLSVDAHFEWTSDPRSTMFMRWFFQSGMTSSLKSLYMVACTVATEPFLSAVESIVGGTKASLVELSLSFGVGIPLERLSDIFAELTHLRLFSIKVPGSSNGLDSLSRMLHSDAEPGDTPPKLLSLVTILDQLPNITPPTVDKWTTFDAVLQEARFKSLKNAAIRRSFVKMEEDKPVLEDGGSPVRVLPDEDDAEQWRAEFRRLLPLTKSRNILKAEFQKL